MDVYRGADKVAELNSYDELRVGANKPAFIYEGVELVYPNPIKDGLVLWYDFSGRTNGDAERGVAEDLSGNDNHGTLQNFNYAAESGYQDGGLKFDGVDDTILQQHLRISNNSTISIVFQYPIDSQQTQKDVISWGINVVLRATQSGRVLFIDKRKKPDRFTGDILFNTSSPVNIDVTTTSESNHIYVNGVLSGKLHADEFDLVDVSDPMALTPLITGYVNNGSVYSTKIYNRPLTPEEIQHNYQIEKERFNL